MAMTVRIIFKDGREDILNNITEIHYNFPSSRPSQVAFESDIEQIGITMPIEDIKEFEAIGG